MVNQNLWMDLLLIAVLLLNIFKTSESSSIAKFLDAIISLFLRIMRYFTHSENGLPTTENITDVNQDLGSLEISFGIGRY